MRVHKPKPGGESPTISPCLRTSSKHQVEVPHFSTGIYICGIAPHRSPRDAGRDIAVALPQPECRDPAGSRFLAITSI
jgi:hypothetical protein